MKYAAISKRQLIPAAMIIVLATVLYSCGGGGYGGGGSSMSAIMTVQTVACPAIGTTDVSIVSMTVGYNPANIVVPVNSVVKWTNNDTMTHTVTSTVVPLYGNFDMQVNPGASVCLKFTSGGTFTYHCSIHPTMPGGSVTVQ